MGSLWSYVGEGEQTQGSQGGTQGSRRNAANPPTEVFKTPTASILNAVTSGNTDYDPHLHREVPKQINNFETIIHLVKCCLGTGILAMPQGFTRAGLIIGIILTLVVGIIITHCLHVLVDAQYKACKLVRKPLLTYTESLKVAISAGPPRFTWFARPAGILVDAFLVIYEIGICCSYIIFMASNIKKVTDPHYFITMEGWMGILFLPLIFINLIPDLKVLAPFSAAANVFTILGLIIIVHYLLVGIKSDSVLDLWGSPQSLPLFFGTIMFALASPGVVLAIENNMQTPKVFNGWFGLMNISMMLIVFLYVVIGGLGYACCLSKCSDSITLDLPEGGGAITVIVLMVLAVFISYVLHCYVPVKVLWQGYLFPWLQESDWTLHLRFWEYLLRITLCVITFIISLAIPRLGLFISLFGAFCLSALGICFPALMEACLAHSQRHQLYPVIVKDAFLIIIGLIGLVAGTYTAIVAIVKSFKG